MFIWLAGFVLLLAVAIGIFVFMRGRRPELPPTGERPPPDPVKRGKFINDPGRTRNEPE